MCTGYIAGKLGVLEQRKQVLCTNNAFKMRFDRCRQDFYTANQLM